MHEWATANGPLEMAYGVAEYERDAEGYCQATASQTLAYLAGTRAAPDLGTLFQDWGYLFGIDLYEQLDQEPIEINRRRSLVAFAARGHLQRAGQEQLEQLAEHDATASVEWEAQNVPLRAVPTALANMADPGRRHRLDEAARASLATRLDVQRSLQEAWLQAFEDLGRGKPDALWDELLGLRLDSLGILASDVLSRTEPRYRDALQGALRLADLDQGDAWDADLAWLSRGAEFDAEFLGRELVPRVRLSILRIGLRLEEQSAITLDIEPRATKSPRPVCVALHVPFEAHVLLPPRGGWHDVYSLLGLLGRAEFTVNMDPALPMPYRWLGDSTLRHGYAELMRGLIADPFWLSVNTSLVDTSDFVQRVRLARLVELRTDAAWVAYEPRLRRTHPDEWEGLQQEYVDEMTAVLGVHAQAERFVELLDDEPFNGALRLRGALFGAQLRDYLAREYGEEWFGLTRAGKFLVELWREGTRYTAEELLRFMGYDDFELDPLVRQLS